ncbi:MAG: hypothetical protein JKY65_15475 [Planctomycetes bacterium]|nr:hypothetical protein [Planctomycetota bacterium]
MGAARATPSPLGHSASPKGAIFLASTLALCVLAVALWSTAQTAPGSPAVSPSLTTTPLAPIPTRALLASPTPLGGAPRLEVASATSIHKAPLGLQVYPPSTAALALASSGGVVIALTNTGTRKARDSTLWISKDAGARWAPLNPPGGSALRAGAIVSRNDAWHLLHLTDDAEPFVSYTRYDALGWGATTRVFDRGAPWTQPVLAFDGSARLLAIGLRRGVWDSYLRRHQGGRLWSELERLPASSDPGQAYGVRPMVVAGRNGDLHVTYRSRVKIHRWEGKRVGYDEYGIYYRRWSPGTEWSAPRLVSTHSSDESHLSLSPTGEVRVLTEHKGMTPAQAMARKLGSRDG